MTARRIARVRKDIHDYLLHRVYGEVSVSVGLEELRQWRRALTPADKRARLSVIERDERRIERERNLSRPFGPTRPGGQDEGHAE